MVERIAYNFLLINISLGNNNQSKNQGQIIYMNCECI